MADNMCTNCGIGMSVPARNHAQCKGAQETNTNAKAAAMTAAAGGLGLFAVANTDFFRQICDTVKERTGGRLNVHLIAAACVAANAARSTVPVVLNVAFDRFKTNVSSSVTVSANEYALYNGLLRLAREKAATGSKPWYSFSGLHEQYVDGQFENLPGNSQNIFYHNGTWFILEKRSNASSDKDTSFGDIDEDDVDKPTKLILRCFGHSIDPVVDLVEEIEQQTIEGD